MSGFKMNAGWEKELQREIQGGVNQIAGDLTRTLSQFHRRYSGQPAATIKPALARLFRQEGLSIPDRDLTYYADQISKGVKIEFKADKFKL